MSSLKTTFHRWTILSQTLCGKIVCIFSGSCCNTFSLCQCCVVTAAWNDLPSGSYFCQIRKLTLHDGWYDSLQSLDVMIFSLAVFLPVVVLTMSKKYNVSDEDITNALHNMQFIKDGLMFTSGGWIHPSCRLQVWKENPQSSFIEESVLALSLQYIFSSIDMSHLYNYDHKLIILLIKQANLYFNFCAYHMMRWYTTDKHMLSMLHSSP